MLRRLKAAALAALLCACAGVPNVSNAVLAGGNQLTPVDSDFFGMHFASLNGWLNDSGTGQPYFTPYVDFGQKWIRAWDIGTTIKLTETSNNVFYWPRLDGVLAKIPAGTKVLFTIACFPTWATGGLDGTGSYNPNPPTSNSYWTHYVDVFTQNYLNTGKVQAVSNWNEFNASLFWNGTTQQQADQTILASPFFKGSTNPPLVGSPSATSFNSQFIVDQLFKAGVNASNVDFVEVHPYISTAFPEPEYMLPIVKAFRAVMNANGMSALPLWATEYGWFNTGTFAQAKAAGYAFRGVFVLAGYTKKQFFYNADNPLSQIQLIDPTDHATVTMAGLAIKYAVSLIAGGAVGPLRQQGFLFYRDFVTPDKRIGRAVWTSPGDSTTQTFSTTGFSSGTDVVGTSLGALSPTMTATASPIVLFRN